MPTIQREGFIYQIAPSAETDFYGNPLDTEKALLYKLQSDFVAMGFTRIQMDGANPQDSKIFLFEPTSAVDSQVASNPWRVLIYAAGNAEDYDTTNDDYPVKDRGLYMVVGSREQMMNIDLAMQLPYHYPVIPPTVNTKETWTAGVINIGDQDFTRISVRFPMAYRLTVANRGFVFAAWIQVVTEDLKMMGVMCVQRGVGCDGLVSETGQRPLWMVTNVSPVGVQLATSHAGRPGPRNAWFYSVIREIDNRTQYPAWESWQSGTGIPSRHNDLYFCTNFISDSREYLGTALNYFPTRWYTPVTTDTGEYVLIFPFGLCTNRFAFSEEIDLIAVSKADAYQHGQPVPLNVYGENRVYTAYNSNNANVNFDSGIRVFLLTEGGGAS